MRTHARALAAISIVAVAALAAGCSGHTGTSVARGSNRTIDVTMTDNAYQPTDLRVTKGETVTFAFKNNGTVRHEAILGDDAAQTNHHAEMANTTVKQQMEHGKGHGSESDTNTIAVEPGRTGEITHTFTESGNLVIGCHEPGHWESGMKANVTIT